MRWFNNRRASTTAKSQILAAYASGQGDVEVVTGPLGSDVPVPPVWQTLHGLAPLDRVKTLAREWDQAVGNVMPATIAALRAHATDVEVMRIGPWHMLLYSIVSGHGPTHYFVGGNPRQPVFPKEGGIQRWWADVPGPLQGFYETTHDGFHDVPSRALGPAQLRDVKSLPWLSTAELYPDARSSMFTFCSDFGGRHLVLDLADGHDASAWVIAPDMRADERVAFWQVVDSWTSAGIRADNPADRQTHMVRA